jgi:peroxiredoxin
MKKKIIITAFALLIIALFSYAIIKIKHTVETNQTAKINRQRLPNFVFYNVDSVLTDYRIVEKNISACIFYFNADCEHCQYEAREISKNIKLFKSAQIVMVSTNTLAQIKQFGKQYQLNYPNITLLQDPKHEFSKWFGKSSIPSVYIYNSNHQLVREYQGETKIEAIVKYL